MQAAHLPSLGHSVCWWIYQSLGRMASVTSDLWLPSQSNSNGTAHGLVLISYLIPLRTADWLHNKNTDPVTSVLTRLNRELCYVQKLPLGQLPTYASSPVENSIIHKRDTHLVASFPGKPG